MAFQPVCGMNGVCYMTTACHLISGLFLALHLLRKLLAKILLQ